MKFNPNRYDLILLFAVVSGIYYVIDETLNNAPPRRTAETLPVVFSVDASPQTAAGLVQGLIKGQPGWCHVPVGARQAWDFALVDTELNGEAATAVYRLDGAPAWDVVYAPNNRSACHRYADGACLAGDYYRTVQCTNQISRRVPLALNVTSTPSTRRDATQARSRSTTASET